MQALYAAIVSHPDPLPAPPSGKVHKAVTQPTGADKRVDRNAQCGVTVTKSLAETTPHPSDLCGNCWTAAEIATYWFDCCYEYAVQTPVGREDGRFISAVEARLAAARHPLYSADAYAVGHVPDTGEWVRVDGTVVS